MTLNEITLEAKEEARVDEFDGIDVFIQRVVNREYRRVVNQLPWRELIVYGYQFDTVANQDTYTAPYMLSQIINDGAMYDWQSDTLNGRILATPDYLSEIQRRLWVGNIPSDPQAIVISGTVGTSLYSTGTVAVTNRGTAVTGTGTTFTSAMEGEYIKFGYSSAEDTDGGDYGYVIESVGGATSLTLATPYRGETLTLANYEIRPSTSPQFKLIPEPTEGDLVVNVNYLRRPARIYNPEDAPEVERLSNWLETMVAMQLCRYTRDNDGAGYFSNRAADILRQIQQSFAY